MKKYQVFKFTPRNGDQSISLVNELCVPYAYASYFITSELYLDNHSINSFEKHVYELKFVLECFDRHNINIEKRIEATQYLNDSEIRNFIDAAKKKKDDILKQQNVIELPVPSDKNISNAIFNASVAQQRVSPATTNGRISTSIRYFEYLNNYMHTGIQSDLAVKQFERMIALLKRSKITISSKRSEGVKYDGLNSVIPDKKYYKMLEIIDPDSPDNPFKHSRERNQLMIYILSTTGIRRGALAKLKIQDIIFTGEANRIYINRTPEDPSDTRKNKPQQKTKAHSVYIAPRIVMDIQSYIENIRSKISQAQTHDFLFVSEMNTRGTVGAPLSLKAIDYIFEVVSKTLGIRIHAHLLRHKWNEIFSDKTEHLSDDEREKRRIDAMGWSKNSKMPECYNHHKNLIKAFEIQKQIQQSIFSNSNATGEEYE